MALNVYLPIVRGWKPLDMEAVQKWFHIYPMVLGCICAVIGAATTTAGPLAFWCWITCEEEGIPSENLNVGMCWMRIVVLYGPLILNSGACLCILIPMVRLLLSHVRKATSGATATSGGGEGAKKGFKKTVLFLLVYSGIVIGASVGRVRGALKVDKATEGKISITEYSAALIPMCVVGIFAFAKWINPFSKQKTVFDASGASTSARSASEKAGSERENNSKKVIPQGSKKSVEGK
jgi:hypothetical protein